GQWFMAHGAGGLLVAGAVRLRDGDDNVGRMHAGEVIELTVNSSRQNSLRLGKLAPGLLSAPLRAEPVGQLMRDAGTSV
ncbi:MAG: hypothetical protein ACRDPA_28685, partial [Solirubrobacteraceae bacterium]